MRQGIAESIIATWSGNRLYRSDAETWDTNNNFASRRSSYFGGEYPHPTRPRTGTNKATGDIGPSPPRHSMHGGGGGGYYGSQNGFSQHSMNGPPRASRYANNRMQSESQLYGRPYPQPQHGYHQSYDTVNTGMTNGSDSTGPWANSTDPSSENSSLDRVTAMTKPQTPGMDGYGQYPSNGYNGPIMEEQGPNAYGAYTEQNDFAPHNGMGGRQDGFAAQQSHYAQQDGYGRQDGYGMPNGSGMHNPPYGRTNGAPLVQQPPPANGGRRPIPLNSGAYGMRSPDPLPPTTRQEPAQKRKSWLKRRFSKD